jgi:hypothetical protein
VRGTRRAACEWARRKPLTITFRIAALLFVALAVGACGGNGRSTSATDDSIGPIAYVVTECHEDGHTIVARQKLQIRDKDQEITVREFPLGPLPSFGLCYQFALGRLGINSVAVLPFQRLGFSPDGSTVVFEVTDDHSILAPLLPLGLLPPGEEEGIFAV